MNKIILTIIPSILIGIIIGYCFTENKTVHKIKNGTENLETRTTLLNKSNTPSPCSPSTNDSHQLEEARELYGKAFLLFLANLGINLDIQQKNTFNKMIDNPSSFGLNEKTTDPPSSQESNPSQKQYKQTENNQVSLVEYLKPMEEKIAKDDINKFITGHNQKIIKNPALFRVQSKKITSYKEVKKYNGRYVGKLLYVDSKKSGQVHDVYIQVEFEEDYDKPENDLNNGNYQFKLTYEGHTYSDKNSNGPNSSIKSNNNEIILDVAPDTFLHLQKGSLIEKGLLYRENKLIGIIQVKKVI